MLGTLSGFRAPPRVFSVGCVVLLVVLFGLGCACLLSLSPLEGWLMSSSFVQFVPAPSSVSLGRGSAVSVEPVAGVGISGAVVVGSAWALGSASSPRFLDSSSGASSFCVFLAGRAAPLVCLVSALSASDLALLVASAASAGSAGVPVFPVVAAGAGRAASGFFCGLASAAPGSAVAPAPGSFAS